MTTHIFTFTFDTLDAQEQLLHTNVLFNGLASNLSLYSLEVKKKSKKLGGKREKEFSPSMN